MGKKNQRKRDKKRKAKRPDRRAKQESLAYRGNKYKTEELVMVLYRAEVGIYETFVMTERKLTDHTVTSALERLIRQIRRGPLEDLEDTSTVHCAAGGEADLVIWNIRRNWQDLFQTAPRPSRDNLVGVLRTILGSVEIRRSPAPSSQGYLRYVEGFLKEMGVSVEAVPPPIRSR